ncbi:MAG: IS30 family transposase [Gammaproteobacteria bacterium]|nr:IS30 family transposase [Gammaproteobacteria bacterium]
MGSRDDFRGFSSKQQIDIWARWRKGESLSEIGRGIGKHAGSIHHLIGFYGGISPLPRSRSKKALTLEEREEISRGLVTNLSIRQMAAQMNRAPSTICREISRHGGKKGYRACQADNRAWAQARRPKQCHLAKNEVLRNHVADKIVLNWSPEQISGWLKHMYPDDLKMQISPETIYKSLYIQARGILKKELCQHLRTRRLMRTPKNTRMNRSLRGQIIDGVSIRERPPEIEDRAIPGHWEGDLITGSKNTHIATLVERYSRFTILVKLQAKDTVNLVNALAEKMKKLPEILRLSLTWDRGMELAHHRQLTLATNLKIYFCNPRSPWQRGTNENTNCLLRQYFPKKTDLSIYSQEHLDQVALQLNQRPRKTLAFYSPIDKLAEALR